MKIFVLKFLFSILNFFASVLLPQAPLYSKFQKFPVNDECQKTYFENFGELPKGDIKLIDEKSIPSHQILCAGFPCQPFSISGRQKGFADTRGTIFFEICRIIKEKNPPVVMLENVKHLVHHDHGNTLKTIIQNLEDLGYTVSSKVLNALDFGVPQNRERIIIIGSKNGIKFDFTKVKTQKRKKLIDFLDKDGKFEFLREDSYTLLENPKQQKSGLIFAGYRNKSIRKIGIREGTEYLSRVHKQPNRIYSVLGSHPTLPSQEPSGRFFILLENGKVRKLTLNECWRIMGFPENYKKISSTAEQYKQQYIKGQWFMSFIGNVIWFLLIGWWESIVWAFYGLIFCITIIGIPIGIQCFKIAKLGAVPFGRTIIDTGNTGSTIANIIWFIVAGLWIGLTYLAAVAVKK